MKSVKRILFFIGAIIVFNACEQSDCVCRYYDENNKYVGQESWDGTQVNASQCKAMENSTEVEVESGTVKASSVNCNVEW